MPVLDIDNYPLQKETDLIIKLALEVHKNLGAGFLEIVYKDAMSYEFDEHDFLYQREKEFDIKYKKAILNHKFYADFVLFEKVIVEIKAKQGGIAEEDLAQTINYLKVSGCKVGLIFNFTAAKLQIKRVVF
jgi:GxxExxY protein